MSVKVITVSSHRPHQSYYCYDEFFLSLKKFGTEPILLPAAGSFSLIHKPIILREYLRGGNVKEKYMIFADCWDIIFVKSPEEILAEFLKFNTSIVFSTERNLWPPSREHYRDRFICNSPWRYLNCGFYIGETLAISQFLESMDLTDETHRLPDGSMHHAEDQEHFMDTYFSSKYFVKLDTACNLCQCLHDDDEKNFHVYGDGLFNRVTGTRAGAIHANGNAKDRPLFQNFLKQWKEANA